MARVLYGLVAPSDELRRQIDAGEIVMGGCTIGLRRESLFCSQCKRWYAESPGRKDAW